ncbi:hypothetical protein [Desulfovermiculus halophilus]|uniref:hypothetical protein n=1 Tax=Desulfovermiculus halophilus TaxID=339722 RepID=UPI0012947470|nr:hypothetical protein [Desulfovermiculus halophilus]
MSTIIPKDKKVRDALQRVSDRVAQGEDRKKAVRDAVFTFNLDPKQEDYLYRLLADQDS